MKKLALILSGITLLTSSAAIVFLNFNPLKSSGALEILEEKFFPQKNSLPENMDRVSMVAVGDIMLSRNVGQKMETKGYEYPFAEVKNYLKTGDIVFGNLETSITPGRIIKTGETNFRADIESAEALKNSGFNILSLANNHTPNFGQKGLIDTFKYLAEVEIKFMGAGKNESEAYAPAHFKANGITFAFLAYNDTDVVPASYGAGASRAGTAIMNTEKMKADVIKEKTNNDFVIVSMHSGTEYVALPNKSQIDFARAAIDAGADLIIGHHPHVVQSAEVYKDKYIFYSLGNFIFDQMWSEETRRGLSLKITFTKKQIEKIEFIPIKIFDYSQPKIISGDEAQKILNRLKLPLTEKNYIITN